MGKTKLFYEDIKPLKIDVDKINYYLKKLIDNELKSKGDISIIFCSDGYLLKMNQTYLNHNYFTDIITFDYVENNIISGDLFISYDRVIENAKIYQTKVEQELLRVIFHGVLHLIGYNDKMKEEKEIMREKENYYLKMVDFEEIKL
ncbi:MAG: rRNA maturation RNase YbeY [Draconibacterium sp.]|nr:MAG: rRNA maturation RNase YbeY [Draconibacterium sp.]